MAAAFPRVPAFLPKALVDVTIGAAKHNDWYTSWSDEEI